MFVAGQRSKVKGQRSKVKNHFYYHFWELLSKGRFDAGKSNPSTVCLGTPLVDRGTNGNRVFWKVVPERQWDAGKSNPTTVRLETPSADRGTNGNQVRREHVCLGYLGAGRMNPRSNHVKTPLVDQEPLGIGFAGNKLFWDTSMRGTRIRCRNTSRTASINHRRMEIEFAGKYFGILDRSHNWNPVFRSHLGIGPYGKQIKGQTGLVADIDVGSPWESFFAQAKAHSQLPFDVERWLLIACGMAVRRKRQALDVQSWESVSTDKELKIVVEEAECHCTALPTGINNIRHVEQHAGRVFSSVSSLQNCLT